MKLIFRHIVIFVLMLTSASSVAQEFRFGAEYERILVPRLETALELQLRNNLEDTDSPVDNMLTQFSAGYKAFDWLTISGTYRYMLSRDDEDDSHFGDLDKHRLTADLSLKTKRFGNDVRLSLRTRYQYTQTEGKQKVYMRNRLKLKYTVNKRASVYTALEPYYSFEHNELSTTRIYFGSTFEILKQEFDAYMILELTPDKKKGNIYRIGGIGYRF